MSKGTGVCHIISSFHPVIGGAERATQSLCRELKRNGLDVIVLTRRYPGLAKFDEVDGVPVYRLGYPSRTRFGAISFGLHALWALATRFRRYRILHLQNLDTPLLVGLVAKSLLGRRLALTIQGETMIALKARSRLGRIRLRLMASRVDVVGALSDETRHQVLAAGTSPARVRLIPNGIDTQTFHPSSSVEKRLARSELGLPESDTIALFVGRLIPLKRVDLLLEAWSRLPQSGSRTLLIVGDGAERRALEDLAARRGLDTVRFEGGKNNVSTYLRAADLFVLPSQQEGLSVALLEAMASGLAVIVTNLPGNTTLVRHRETGLVFPVDDLDSLVAQLTLSIQHPGVRDALGRNAREMVCAGIYSLTSVAQAYQHVYRDLLDCG